MYTVQCTQYCQYQEAFVGRSNIFGLNAAISAAAGLFQICFGLFPARLDDGGDEFERGVPLRARDLAEEDVAEAALQPGQPGVVVAAEARLGEAPAGPGSIKFRKVFRKSFRVHFFETDTCTNCHF